GAAGEDRVGLADEGERGHQDLVAGADPEGEEGDVHRLRRTRGEQDVRGARPFGEAPLDPLADLAVADRAALTDGFGDRLGLARAETRTAERHLHEALPRGFEVPIDGRRPLAGVLRSD